MKRRGASIALVSAALAACSARSIIGVTGDEQVTAGRTGVGGDAVASGGGVGASAPGGSEADGGAPGRAEPGDVDPLFPYPKTSYSEPFRQQFHFSPASGWMNDVDGLWFSGGVYHLTHQASPFAFAGGKGLHWGHATSTDLLHWRQQPLMLVPGYNVEGEAWSGSVVVDANDTAGSMQGKEPTVVAVYTSTRLGTSLSFSNDGAKSFTSYDKNPLAIGNADFETNRDPTVVWHQPSQRWVCVYWEDGGTTFYTSPDLKAWTRASSVAFGDVVPDFYELPVDGDAADKRWVLQNSDGKYLVGSFDGQTFTPEAEQPLDLDVGPDFFAAHTFFRQTFPDARVVQIAWLRDGGIATAPFRGSATFPAELTLSTTPTGLVVTRRPVSELTKLYGPSKHWGAQQLAAGKNLLAGVRAKTFDFELTLSLAESRAKTLELAITDQKLTYDLAAQTLEGAAFPALGDQLTLRFLVDWSSVEVFGAAASYSASLPFAPDEASLSLSADGVLSVSAADFRVVGRAWPGPADTDAQVVDDADAAVDYSGGWSSVTGDATFFDGTCHYSTEAGAALEASFTGTRLAWYGLRNADLGLADVFIDDVLVAEGLDCYAASRVPAQLLLVSGLKNSFHTLRIVARGDKNPSASGSALVHDYFISSVE
ncbi:MAG TPA: glycoside hydrolase family 32 protein [Polyangiaceae bacterium]|nr:glycoside hydrolase family 32 protein [Polyangiaceae bacterium]